ncbi:hypothetical protein NPIL_107901 [Nephila pilipes]|uniref:Uncharacterized protein n=1 Tax=Nephila pilipes TaxID=299642 RepID=A0A8X6UQT4_NEPPI|nr:hypothetical protein NPIL_107901 [Nephila pilipes]
MRWNPRSPDAQVIRTASHAFHTNCQTVEKLFRSEVLKRLPDRFDSTESCFEREIAAVAVKYGSSEDLTSFLKGKYFTL